MPDMAATAKQTESDDMHRMCPDLGRGPRDLRGAQGVWGAVWMRLSFLYSFPEEDV